MTICCINPDTKTVTKYVKIRLRGAVEERKISHIGDTAHYYSSDVGSTKRGYGLLGIGFYSSNPTGAEEPLALQLEDKVTLDGKNTEFPKSTSHFNVDAMVQVSPKGRLIMEEGSKITGFKASNFACIPIMMYECATFIMKGGEISGTAHYAATYPVVCITYAPKKDDTKTLPATVSINGGVFKNNTYNEEPIPNYIVWGGTGSKWIISVPENDPETTIHFTDIIQFKALVALETN
jgi:hypothetical protein